MKSKKFLEVREQIRLTSLTKNLLAKHKNNQIKLHSTNKHRKNSKSYYKIPSKILPFKKNTQNSSTLTACQKINNINPLTRENALTITSHNTITSIPAIHYYFIYFLLLCYYTTTTTFFMNVHINFFRG